MCPHLSSDSNGETYYVAADECNYKTGQARGTGMETFYTIYSALIQSLGLKKYRSVAFPYAYFFIALCTEVQAWAFNHPYFEAYVI